MSDKVTIQPEILHVGLHEFHQTVCELLHKVAGHLSNQTCNNSEVLEKIQNSHPKRFSRPAAIDFTHCEPSQNQGSAQNPNYVIKCNTN